MGGLVYVVWPKKTHLKASQCNGRLRASGPAYLTRWQAPAANRLR
jgi:hypothetical protein